LTSDEFDEVVKAFVDNAKFDSEGKLKIQLSVDDIDALKRKLKIPPGDDLSFGMILKSLADRVLDNCPGGRCGGTVTQKFSKPI